MATEEEVDDDAMPGPSLAWQGGGPKEEGEVIYGLGLRFGASGFQGCGV